MEHTQVRTIEDLTELDGLVLPGGESTAMSLIGDRNGIFGALRQWVERGRPVWGTCAGCIMLAKDVQGQKQGGQGLIGGMDISVSRNYFGRQVASFEQDIQLTLPLPLQHSTEQQSLATQLQHPQSDSSTETTKDITYPGVFIRAPAILSANKGVQVLGIIPFHSRSPLSKGEGEGTVIVAAQQGSMLATVFHPELTSDTRVHEYFAEMVRAFKIIEKRNEK